MAEVTLWNERAVVARLPWSGGDLSWTNAGPGPARVTAVTVVFPGHCPMHKVLNAPFEVVAGHTVRLCDALQ